MNFFLEEPKLAGEELLNALSPFRELVGLEVDGLAEGRLSRGSDLRLLTKNGLTEVSGKGGGAVLTLAFSLLREAQQRAESVLWLSSPLKPFYPPDGHRSGVDLKRLPVLFLARPQEALWASLKLLGSGGFGLLVWDMASWKKPLQTLPLAFLGRLNAIARHHRASILLLTDKQKTEPSLGCLVSLRLQVEAQEEHPDLLEVEVVRDKRGIARGQRRWQWRCQLPDGLPSSAPVPSATSFAAKARMAG